MEYSVVGVLDIVEELQSLSVGRGTRDDTEWSLPDASVAQLDPASALDVALPESVAALASASWNL